MLYILLNVSNSRMAKGGAALSHSTIRHIQKFWSRPLGRKSTTESYQGETLLPAAYALSGFHRLPRRSLRILYSSLCRTLSSI